jgi:hypothetical protein
MSIPAGWAVHPSSPAHMYELANPQNVHPIQQPAAVAAPVAAQATPPVHNNAYGVSDVNIDEELAGMASGGFGDTIWLDFDKLNNVGEESELLLRFLPPWAIDQSHPYAAGLRHRIWKSLVPDSKAKGEYAYVECYEGKFGPKDCPICKTVAAIRTSASIDADMMDKVKQFNASVRIRWQALNMNDPNKHWVQQKDDSGNVLYGTDGQPLWSFQPGIFAQGKMCQRKILSLWRTMGDPTNPDNGYSILVKKTKTGPNTNEVDFSTIHMEKCPLDEAYRGVLNNLIDIPKDVLYFRDRSVMQQIADNIQAKYGGGVSAASVSNTQTWQPHPQNPAYEWNPATNAVRPIAAPAPAPVAPPIPAAAPPMPAPAPAPAAAPVAAPPPMPGYHPPQAAAAPPAPPGAPPALPPPTAPGLQGGAPTGPVQVPPTAPGMPPGMAPNLAPPPMPAAAPPAAPGPVPGAMSPGQLEQHLAAPPGQPAAAPPPPPVALPPAPPPPPGDDGTPF